MTIAVDIGRKAKNKQTKQIMKRYLDTPLQRCLTHLFILHATSYPFVNVKCIYIRIHVFVGRLINFVKLNASYIHTLYV